MKEQRQKSLANRFEREVRKNRLIREGDNIIVAVSGGPDSVCLFYLLLELQDKLNFKLSVCHYNHCLRGEESDADQQLVEDICRQHNISCVVGKAANAGECWSEEGARDARYNFFKKILEGNRGAKIALAHNENDLAETILLRIVRGTGLRGLRSIPQLRENFIRPLLPFSRQEIEQYLALNGINYRLDRSNQDIRFARNFVRHRVFPLLQNLNPNVLSTIASSARLLEEDYDFLESIAKKAYQAVLLTKNDSTITLDRAEWISFHPSIKRLVLRMAISSVADLKDITQQQLAEVIEVLDKGVGGKYKPLPHSLRIELNAGKIIIAKA